MALRGKKYANKDLLRRTRNEQRRRYYRKTAKYGKRAWTQAEDELVLGHSIPDSRLSPQIMRSVEAIQNRRHKLRKCFPKNTI